MRLEDGMSYTMDGDIVDDRNRLIQSLRKEIIRSKAKEYSEEAIRDNNPAVKDAWEVYQVLLKLASPSDE